ncbi:MAG: DNA polymerase III subunit beta [Pseudomonadota bacterium]
MKLTTEREVLLAPLQKVIGAVERRQTMPILANVLLVVESDRLSVTATDLEVELCAGVEVAAEETGEVTVPGRKFLDICKALPDGAKVTLSRSGDKVTVKSGRSRFTLSCLEASEFPVVDEVDGQLDLSLSCAELSRLIEKTQFSMAQQDVRYFLNGLLLEMKEGTMRAVATDGHRLSMSQMPLGEAAEASVQVIVPRKGVLELQRLLPTEGEAKVTVGTNHIMVALDGGTRFTSKLIDGRFPDYEKVVPAAVSNQLETDKAELVQALRRASILSNEKYRGIRLELAENRLIIQAHNPEQEEAEEEMEVEYGGAGMAIGFNVTYLIDALAAVDGETVTLRLNDPNSSCLVTGSDADQSKYVVMPMRL